MKVSLSILLFSTLFLFVGCHEDEAAVLGSPTAVSQVTVPTETAVPLNATTEPTPTVTETAVSPQTFAPTSTPTLPPPPTGSVLFLWDSEAPPIEGAERNHTLYLAQPGESVAMWDVQPVLNDLFGFSILGVSPGNTKLMFTNIEDANGDGKVSDASVDRGGDGYVLYVYEFASGQSEKLPIGLYNPHNLAWLSDESLTYRGGVTVYLVHTDGLLGQKIAVFPETIHWIAPSPDGSLIAVNSSGLTSFIDVDTGELISVTGQLGSISVDAVWSPDGQWLALNHRNDQLLLINVDTLEVSLVEAAEEVSYVSWSPDSLQLLLVKIEEEISTLSFLDPQSLTVSAIMDVPGAIVVQGSREGLAIPFPMSGTFWSSDGSRIAFAFSEQDVTKVATLDMSTMEITEIWQRADVAEARIWGWSPDGNWILFSLQQAPHHSELDILHWQGGAAYPIFMADETFPPRSVMWLSPPVINPEN